MSHLLRTNIETKVKLTDEEFEMIARVLRPKVVKRKKDLLRGGEHCRFLAFVEKGCLRSYSVDKKGVEHVIQIATEDYWIADLASFLSGRPGNLFIEAIEESHLILLYGEDLENLYKKIPALDRFFRILYSHAYVSTLDRLNHSFADSAEERYQKLLINHSNITHRVPLIHIASYLGITPESLSRIRKQLASK